MVIEIDAELEAALMEAARRRGVAPEALALSTLHWRFRPAAMMQPRDDWERRLLGIAKDCGVSLSNWAVSSEGIYE